MEGDIANMGQFIGAGIAGLGAGLAALGVGNVAGNFLSGALSATLSDWPVTSPQDTPF